MPNLPPVRTTNLSHAALSHGRARKRWAQRVALILYVVAGLIFFVAWTVMLALLIQILTY